MKYLLVSFFILGVHCVCESNQYNADGICLDCMASPCKVCQGTMNCLECHEGMSPINNCRTCDYIGAIPVNRMCVDCSSLGAFESDGFDCVCRPDGFNGVPGNDMCCPEDKGVYLDSFICKSCSLYSMGCERCTLHKSGYPTCSRCISGNRRVKIEGIWVCIPGKATHLFALGGLLISLLILL